MTLLECRTGCEFRLQEVIADPDDRLLLFELGLVPGASVRVVARGVAGALVVAVGDARVALDARMARQMWVKPAGTWPR
jgi:ferrous iron transport protein A